MKNILVLILMSITCIAFAQTEKKVIHITGVVVVGDSLQPMSFVHITAKNGQIGTTSDYYGYFSLIAHEGDTIEFSSIGYHRNQFILPSKMDENSYSIIHIMIKETIMLKEFIVSPWPSREQFQYAFMNEKFPDNREGKVKENLAKEKLKTKGSTVPLEGSTTYKYELQDRYSQLYQGEGFPHNKLLDPIAWSKFIKAWKNGDFKKNNH